MTLRNLVCLTFLVFTIACGGDSSSGTPTTPAAPPPSQASISVSVSPNPVIAQASPDPRYNWMASWTVNFRESAGLAFNVNFINATLRDATTGVEVGTLNFGAAEVISAAGTNNVGAFGSLSVAQSVVYSLAYGGRQGIVTIAAQCTDQRGNVMNVATQFAVTLKAP